MKKNFNIIIYICSFIFFFLISMIFGYSLSSVYNLKLFYEVDSVRVLNDLSVIICNHYRTLVHPLFVILFQPVILILRIFFRDSLFTSLILQSLLSAGSVLVMKLIFDKLKVRKIHKILLLLIFAFSNSQIIFNGILETYTFAQFFLIFLFYWVIKIKNKDLSLVDYIILIFLGVFSIGITITNFFVYFLAIIYLVFFRKKTESIKDSILKVIILLLYPLGISILFSIIQYYLFPGSKLFFIDNVVSFFNKTSEEFVYMSGINFNSIINQIKAFFCYSFFAPKVVLESGGFNLGRIYSYQKLIVIISVVYFFVYFIFYVRKFFINKSAKIKSVNNYFWLLLISFIFNFCLHLIYGNEIGFLYTLHYQFMYILIISNILKSVEKKHMIISILFLSIFLFIEVISNFYALSQFYSIIVDNGCYPVDYLDIFVAFITIILILCSFIKLKRSQKIVLIIISILLIMLFRIYDDFSKYYKNRNYINPEFKDSYQNYLKQLDMLYEDFDVKVAFDNKSKFMFFGMGNRTKILYKDGTLYNIDDDYKILIKYEIEKEMIIPNEYTVSLVTKDGKEIIIYEDESGVYIKEGDTLLIVDNSGYIDLEEFDDYKYSEILKVLHQEILFNIDESILKPNVIVYENGWYRDAMIATMVLDKTNNLDLIKEWVDSIDKLYDEQNGNKEVDNLGELLYLINITKSNNKIKNDIFKELEKIKNDNYLSGVIDGNKKKYYPTAIFLFALNMEYDINLTLPEYDSYSELVWFYDKNKKVSTATDSINYPYLGWANYHTNGKSALYNCDSLYPLSYEKNGSKAKYPNLSMELSFYKNNHISPTHIWDAAEKFLLLFEYKKI